MTSSPRVVVIAGINGAGKSTAAPSLLTRFGIDTYLDADEIARGLGGDPRAAAVAAGRIMHARIERMRAERRDFALETTLSGMTLRRTIDRLHGSGYRSFMLYLWLPSAAMAVDRVAGRVRLGGHDIPADDVLRRHTRSIWNFENVYRRQVNAWRLYHAARGRRGMGGGAIAEGARGLATIHDAAAWMQFQRQAAQGDEA
jgi:predicted ABC-type ATPase